MKLYQTVEVAGGRAHAKAQIASARSYGCSVSGYVWLYASVPVGQQVRDALSLVAEAGITLPVLWLDIEQYTDGSLPSADQVGEALLECERRGVRGGIYSGEYVWQQLGNPQFPGTPLWSANYNGKAALDVPAYGGMTLVAHQYDDKAADGTGLDRSVFLAEYTCD